MIFPAAVDLEVFLGESLFDKAVLLKHPAGCHVAGEESCMDPVQIKRFEHKRQAGGHGTRRFAGRHQNDRENGEGLGSPHAFYQR